MRISISCLSGLDGETIIILLMFKYPWKRLWNRKRSPRSIAAQCRIWSGYTLRKNCCKNEATPFIWSWMVIWSETTLFAYKKLLKKMMNRTPLKFKWMRPENEIERSARQQLVKWFYTYFLSFIPSRKSIWFENDDSCLNPLESVTWRTKVVEW